MSTLDWQKRFLEEGRLWGDQQSPVGELVHALTRPGSRLLEIGFGYGRDLAYLSRAGRICVGLESLDQAVPDNVCMLRDLPDITCLREDDLANFPPQFGWFDGVYAHRVLHLFSDVQLEALKRLIQAVALPGAPVVLSARNSDGFRPEQMEWIGDNCARYTIAGRQDHTIEFWNERRFEDVFGTMLTNLTFLQSAEQESISNNISCPITIMSARRPRLPDIIGEYVIRAPSADDKPWLLDALFGREPVMRYWMTGSTFDAVEFDQHLSHLFDWPDSGVGYRVIEAPDRKRVGVFGIFPTQLQEERLLEVYILIAEDFQGKGVGKEILRAVHCWNEANRFGDGLLATVHPDNKPSERAVQHAGFQLRRQTDLPKKGLRNVYLSATG